MKRFLLLAPFALTACLALTTASSAETCTQARNACVNNCKSGYPGANAQKQNWCLADCDARRNECLQTGTWRNYRPEFKSRHGLVKQ